MSRRHHNHEKSNRHKCEKKIVKKCSSSSSSSSSSSTECCDKKCRVPKVVYQACVKGGTAKIDLTYALSKNTYTCFTDINTFIDITYTLTNVGDVCIKTPRYIYDSLAGVRKIGKCKLYPGQSDVYVIRHKITQCDCTADAIKIVANGYTQIKCNSIVLVTPPVAITISKVLQ